VFQGEGASRKEENTEVGGGVNCCCCIGTFFVGFYCISIQH